MSILIAIPAAGASRRMRGRDKLLEEVDGVPLLRRQTAAALATDQSVLVLLPPGDAARGQALDGLGVSTETVSDAATGMSASLRTAARYAQGHEGLAILLPDVPGVGLAEMRAVLKAYIAQLADRATPHAIRATDPDGRPGTPIIIPPRLYQAFVHLTGDDGGRRVLQGEEIETLVFPDDRATRDLDTPEDWADWRQTR